MAVAPSASQADSGCPTPVAYSQGSGTLGDPYQISLPGHLQMLRDDSVAGWSKYYLITNDIDMSGCVWDTTIAGGSTGFSGQLDGAGHVISGLSIEVSTGFLSQGFTTTYVGLIGYLQSPGVVTRLGFTGSSKSTAAAGGVTAVRVGGLVGYAEAGTTISYSFAAGAVEAYGTAIGTAGGLVGLGMGTITDSYATGAAIATRGDIDKHAGGFAGYLSQTTIRRVYATGSATIASGAGTASAGGFAGIRQAGLLEGSFWDTTTSATTSPYGFGFGTGNPVGKTTAQMQSFGTFDDSAWPIIQGWAPFDIATNQVWGICEGSTRPFLLWQYSAQTRPCASAPASPAITSVTPSATSASVAFTADDSGGSTITRIEFALDDTTSVDDSTTNVNSPASLNGLTQSTNYAVYMRAVNAQGPGPWSAPVSFRTQGRPGTPVITGVTPDVTTAYVAFTADDSGGSSILAIQFAIDDTLSIDGSTTNVSPLGLAGLSSGTAYTIYLRAMNANGPSPWSAGTSFTTLTPPPPPAPMPPSAPIDVRVTPGDGSVTATWSAPATPGDYPVTNYQATATPGGRSCMTTSITCTISGLRNGTSYTITVRALSGAGWSAASSPSASVTPIGPATKSLVITGSRGSGSERSVITVRGTSTGVEASRATIWLSAKGAKAAQASATVLIRSDGTFAWSRRLNGAAVIYAEASGVRSNTIRIPAAR